MNTPDQFFIPDNAVRLVDELDYNRVDEYIRSAEAFSRSSYQSSIRRTRENRSQEA